MKKLFIKSNLVTAILTVLSITGFVIVENTMTFVKQKHFDEKLKAATMTRDAIKYLKDYRMKNVFFIDKLNDPNETGIIGQKYSQITSEDGSLPVKLSTTNPNFAALAVELLKQAGVKEGDRVAICMTGSFPALNIATLAALEVIKAKPVIIYSVTSSSWGANDPEFTFPDMIRVLQETSYFKNFEFKYASIGGLEDLGMSLSKKGRELIQSAIERNHLTLINTGSLQSNIAERIRIIDEFSSGKPIKAFINIGGGIASLGTAKNAEKIPSGLIKNFRINTIPDKSGVLYEMAKRNIPIINLTNFEKLMKEYDLAINPVPLPQVGQGELFYIFKYDMKIVLVVTIVLLIAIAFFVYVDRKNHKLGNDIISDEIQI